MAQLSIPDQGYYLGLCTILSSENNKVSLTNLQVSELQRAVDNVPLTNLQKPATKTQAAAAVQTKIDEKVAEELKKVAASNIPTQPVQTVQTVQATYRLLQLEKTNDGDGDLVSSWHSQGARRRQQHAERATQLLTYQETYAVVARSSLGHRLLLGCWPCAGANWPRRTYLFLCVFI